MSEVFRLVSQTHAPAGALAPAETGEGLWWLVEPMDAGAPLAWLHAQPRIGLCRPRYSFHLGRVVHAATELGLHQVQHTLQLGHDATGESELSSLYVNPALPEVQLQGVLEALLQAALGGLRAQRASQPDGLVLVELPGWRDAQGRHPFWDGLVQPFLPSDVSAARLRLGTAFSSHLGPLLPRQLIHTAFLPEAVQAVLGKPETRYLPWLQALRTVGFSDWRHLRIDDGGPIWARSLS
jgi:arginine N-succinyltransferase